MNAAERETVQLALNQIEAVIRDLHWGSPNGYVMGYELGYMKGVLEHVLRTHPDIQTRGAYLQGYVNGYSQGLLYLVRCNAIERPQGARRGITRRALGLHRHEDEIRPVSRVEQTRSTDPKEHVGRGITRRALGLHRHEDEIRPVSHVEQTRSSHNGKNENLVQDGAVLMNGSEENHHNQTDYTHKNSSEDLCN